MTEDNASIRTVVYQGVFILQTVHFLTEVLSTELWMLTSQDHR